MAADDDRTVSNSRAARAAEEGDAEGVADAARVDGLEGVDADDGDGEPDADVGDAIRHVLQRRGQAVDRGRDAITDLQSKRRNLNAQKRELTKQLRNEARKRKRMLNRSAGLTNYDLVEVLTIRQHRSLAKAKAKAAAA